MSERRPDLHELVEAAGTPPTGVSVATNVIAESQPSDLTEAVRKAEINSFSAEMTIRMAPLLDANTLGIILQIASQGWDDNLQEGYEAQGAALQRLASKYHKDGIIPPASVLNAIFAAQEEAEKPFPADMADSLVEPALESLEESQAAQEEGLEEDRARELNEDLELANEIVRKRVRFFRTRRWVTVGLASLALGGGVGGLTYQAKQDLRDSLSKGDTPALTQKHTEDVEELPDLPDIETKVAAGIAAVLGGVTANLLLVTGEGFIGRSARRKARRLVKKAEAAAA